MTDRVPGIGSVRGIFEIFIPGLFLLLNISAALYLLPRTNIVTNCFFERISPQGGIIIIAIVPFGYFAGVMLRLLKTELPDKISRVFWCLRLGRKRKDPKFSWATDRFPYPVWIIFMADKTLPEDVANFYKNTLNRYPHNQYVNFCKNYIASRDALGSAEIYSAEALSRYVSGMFYALSISLVLALFIIFSTPHTSVIIDYVKMMTAIYVLGLLCIVSQFRLLRIKEVETIFSVAYRHKKVIP